MANVKKLRLQDLCAVKTAKITESAGVKQASNPYAVNGEDKQIKDENIYTQVRLNNEESTFLKPCIVPRDESSLHELQTSRDGTKNCVHVGFAVGLLCVGLAVGAIVTCLLCTCVPRLNRKATIVMMMNGASRRDAKQHEHTGLQPQVRRTALARANSSITLVLHTTISADDSNRHIDKEEYQKCIRECKEDANIINSDQNCSDYNSSLILTCCNQLITPTKTPTTGLTTSSNSNTVVTSTATTVGDTNNSSKTTSMLTNPVTKNSSLQSQRTSCDTVGQDGVSLGLAIGLLFVGIAIGVLITCLLCVCVPTLNRKATSVLSSRKLLKQKKDMMVPSAPQTSLKLQYESNVSVHDNRDSHIYSGIQTETPLPDGRQITSPVYNVISEDNVQALVTKGPNADYQGLYNTRADATYRQLDGPGNSVNNSIGLTGLEDDGDEATNHNYFTLIPPTECFEDKPDMADNTDNTAYFVLDKNPSGNEETKCESQHDYFILKKE